MICAQCGVETDAGARFCWRCGAARAPAAVATEATVPDVATAARPMPHPAAAQPELSRTLAQPPVPPLPPLPPPPHDTGYGYAYQPAPQPATSRVLPAQQRVAIAHVVLWGGLLLSLFLISQVDYLKLTRLVRTNSSTILPLGELGGHRIDTVLVLLAPYLLAALIVPSDAVKRVAALCAGALTGVIYYVFLGSVLDGVWVVRAACALLLFTGWLVLRDRPARSIAIMLTAAAVVTAVWNMPWNPGLWLREVPLRSSWSSDYAATVWAFADLALIGLVGLGAAAVAARQRPAPIGLGWSIGGGLAAVCVLAAVISNAVYAPATPGNLALSYQPTSPAAGELTANVASSEVAQVLHQSEGAGASTIDTCGGASLASYPVADYTIGQVSEQTTGTFLVSADVTLTDSSTQVVSYLVGTDAADDPCIESSQSNAPIPASTAPSPSAPAVPADVPSLPAAGEPVPTSSPLPPGPQVPTVIAYTDSGTTPTTPAQLVEYQPSGLTADQEAAVQDVVAFMAYINQQNFLAAWNKSTERLGGAVPSTQFTTGYATTRFYQVAFGQPSQLAAGLIAIPARFVSRQDPAAQGNPAGTTGCTYWPQYVFLIAKSGGAWLNDVAGGYATQPEIVPLERAGSDGTPTLNPLAQRVPC